MAKQDKPLDRLVDPVTQDREWFEKHVAKRHKTLRFVATGEHAADHRLNQEYLDHIHERDITW